MKERSFCAATIAPRRYLALARATASSFLSFHPDVPFYVLVTDGWHGFFDPARERFRCHCLDDLEIPHRERFRFQYDELELAYAATPYWIRFLLLQGFRHLLFLKMETMVVGRLDSLLDVMSAHSLLLTPHFLKPPRRPDAITWELNVLRAGVFNGGVLGVRGCPEGHSFLCWWQHKTALHCLRDVDHGYHFEQRWLDFAPILAPQAHILRDPGVNVGHWNLPERRVEIRENEVWVDDVPGKIFRFSGYEPERPHQVTKYNPGFLVRDTGPAAAIFARYQSLLEENGYFQAQTWPYGYGCFDNGVPISPAARAHYRALGAAVAAFGDPLCTSCPGSFFSWLEQRNLL